MPSVSIIIPVFNDEAGIISCLDALRKQTYPLDRIEVVIVDNGSNPPVRVPDILPFTVRLERCKTPGSYAARNAGVRATTNEILAFTDADCIPKPEWIECGVARLMAEAGKCIVGGNVNVTEPMERNGVSLYQYITGFSQQRNIEQKGFSATANLFCSMRQFMAIGPFAEQLFSGGDREWAWRAAQCGIHIVFEERALVSTPPRASLKTAIRQARRVAAGRKHLRQYSLDYLGPKALLPHRSAMESARWILLQKQLPWWERIKVLKAAIIIKGAVFIEILRLHFGGNAERR